MPVRTEIHEGIVPVKVYTGEIEAAARQQLVNISKLPIVHHHVAAMPDVHLGIGATVGSVIPTKKAIIPAAVGVDIGCGMIASWVNQLGTLGGGNHFIELCLDEESRAWVMLHSGSRGMGNAIGSYFIELAKRDAERTQLQLPERDLAYFPEGAQHFDDYVDAVGWAQDYARANRAEMMELVIDALHRHLPSFEATDEAVNCHHNYVERETHYGEAVWLTRKGAIRAGRGELGIIPGSMGARSRAQDESQCCAEGVLHRRLGEADRGRDLPQGQGRAGRDPRRVQEHRRGDGEPVRPSRGGAQAEAGALRQRLNSRRHR